MDQSRAGDLNWRLSAHPFTLLIFLGFRIGLSNIQIPLPFLHINFGISEGLSELTFVPVTGSLLMYLFGLLFIKDLLVFLL